MQLVPREIMAFNEDTSFPNDLPSYVGHHEVLSYLENFAARERLHGLIRFESKVSSVMKDRDIGCWKVKCCHEGVEQEEDFDA